MILSVLAVGIVFLSLRLLKRKSQFSRIPAVGNATSKEARRKEFLSGKARDLYVEGYKKVRDPPKYIVLAGLNLSSVQRQCFSHHDC